MKRAEKLALAPQVGFRRYLLTVLAADESVLKTMEEIVTKEGVEIKKSESLGKRRLAHKIGGSTELFVLSIFFDAPRSVIKTIEKTLYQEQPVKRFLLSEWKAAVPEAEKRARTRAVEAEQGEEQ